MLEGVLGAFQGGTGDFRGFHGHLSAFLGILGDIRRDSEGVLRV